jgi:hypothetical protein
MRWRRVFFLGLDLGQVNDPTALAVIERVELRGAWDPVRYGYYKKIALRLRHLERMPLGTPYPDVVRRVAAVVRAPELSDATGVGRPVVELLRGEQMNCTILPTVITGGISESVSGNYYHVPKRDVITGLQVAMQQGMLQIAAGMPYVPELMQEMADMRVKISAAGNEQFGAWRDGSHDDLVFAVALACWGAKKAYPGDWSGRQRYWGEL